MRYINIPFYHSMQFFNRITYSDTTYDEYVLQFKERDMKMQDFYERNIQMHFKGDIMYVEDVQKIIFNADGTVRPLDRHIYDQVQKLCQQYQKYEG